MTKFQKLQWGRDQLIAELIPTAFIWLSGQQLQWGRDQLIAELQKEAAKAEEDI